MTEPFADNMGDSRGDNMGDLLADDTGGSLAGKVVLLPRGGRWADSASAEVRRLGAETVVGELIRFVAPADTAPLTAALARLREGDYDWLVVTSPRAVAAIVGADGTAATAPESATGSTTIQPDARQNLGTESAADSRIAASDFPDSTRIAAVGSATATALTNAGLRVDFQPLTEQSARGLVREWPDSSAKRILLPRSSLAEPTVAEGLGQLGIQVDDPVAYQTVGVDLSPALRTRIQNGEVDYVFLTSGSTVREFARQVGTDAPVTVVTIGPITTRDARAAGFAVAYEAATPSIPAMLDAIAGRRDPL
ncbi:MAG: uroporphyrinogen-III synthase [Gulosibacter sp.]|uniref:uroporphyrinogen-III synthase n=1 Tax=Gulosibacter sp. TaxID=2817531 RepID=UPI003F8F59D7